MEPKQPIVFSDENVTVLSNMTDTLGDLLINSHFGGYVDQLSQIRLSAEHRDTAAFTKNVIDRSLFGGMGSLKDIWIKDKEKRENFNKLFGDFIDHLKKMGINNPRIDQVREYFK